MGYSLGLWGILLELLELLEYTWGIVWELPDYTPGYISDYTRV